MKKSFLRVNDDISLQPPYQAYAKDIFKIVDAQRDYLGKWLPWVAHTTAEKNIEDFLKLAYKLNRGGQQLNSFIFFQETLVGSISLVRIDNENKTAEMGYWLSKEMQGKGIITTAAKAMITHSFEILQLHRIEIKVAPANKKSSAIPKKLGFHLDGVLRESYLLGETFIDLEVYSALRREWMGICAE